MPGEPLMVLVTIQSDDGRVCSFECPEIWLNNQEIDVGDEWPEDIDEIDAQSYRIDYMGEWMDNYYDAIEELEE